jgi:hypothetical protein
MGEATTTENALVEAVHEMLDEDLGRAVKAVARAMEERGVRCLLVASRTGTPPAVVVTLTVDDVTAEAVRRVVTPVLRRAGVSEEAIPMMSGAAGAAVSQWLAKQRAKQQQQQAAAAAPPGGEPQGPPKWSPGRRRAGG